MTSQARQLGLALALRVAAILLLALVVAGHPWPSERAHPTVFVLADRSASVAAEPARVALGEVLETARGSAHTASVQLIEFADGPSAAAAPSSPDSCASVLEASCPGELSPSPPSVVEESLAPSAAAESSGASAPASSEPGRPPAQPIARRKSLTAPL